MTTNRPGAASPSRAATVRVKRPYRPPAFTSSDAFERMMQGCNGAPNGAGDKFGQPGPCGPGSPVSNS